MNYDKIWAKTLNSDEKVEFEFSIGKRYIKFWFIVWGFLSLILLFPTGIGALLFLCVLFYLGFYIKIANAYAFTNKRVLIHRGWLSTKTISIDYQKITDVRIDEPFLDRIFFKTGSIIINTAGSNFSEVFLSHVESPYEIKKRLDILKDKK
jgi:uncharacterized membrane protein YdbT with pleckstrin-like domain